MRKYNIYDMMLRGPADKPGGGDDDLDTSGILDEGDGDGEEHEEAHEEDGDEGESQGRRKVRQEDANGEEPDEDDDQGADVLNGEGDDENEEETVEAKTKPAKRTLQDKFREQRDERRKEKERADRIEGQLNELRAERERERAKADAVEEADRVALMTHEERLRYDMNKALDGLKRQQAVLEFKNADEADKAAFDHRARNNPAIAKRAEAVERELYNARKNLGINLKRETVLAQVIGQEVVRRMEAPAKKPQVAKAAARGKPPANGRGDSSSGRRQGSSLEKRLANVSL